MKKLGKRVLVFLMAALLVTGIAATATPVREVKAASNRSVKVQKYVKTKKYRLKKAVKRKKTTIKKTKKTTKSTSTSSAVKVSKVVVKQVNVKTTLKAKKKTVRTETKITTTTTTVNYANSNPADIDQLAGKINAKVITAFKNSGFTVETNPNSPILNGADGVFSPSRKKIVLKENVDRVFIHEIGHFVDRENGYTSGSDKFIDIYNTEKAKFAGDNKEYAASNNREFFAEVFKEYSMNNASLKRSCPKAYEYMKSVLENM